MRKTHALAGITYTHEGTIFNRLTTVQRGIDNKHVSKIESSLETMGQLRPIICAKLPFIEGNQKLWVIDGQHTLEALIRRNDVIAYILIEIKDEKELVNKIAKLNTSSKSWGLYDFVHAWAYLENNIDYRHLLKAANVYDMSISAIACCYSRTDMHNSEIIKNGDWKLMDKANGDLLIDYVNEIFRYIPKSNRMVSRMFIEAYVKMYYSQKSTYNHASFMTYVALMKHDIIELPEKIGDWDRFLNKYNAMEDDQK